MPLIKCNSPKGFIILLQKYLYPVPRTININVYYEAPGVLKQRTKPVAIKTPFGHWTLSCPLDDLVWLICFMKIKAKLNFTYNLLDLWWSMNWNQRQRGPETLGIIPVWYMALNQSFSVAGIRLFWSAEFVSGERFRVPRLLWKNTAFWLLWAWCAVKLAAVLVHCVNACSIPFGLVHGLLKLVSLAVLMWPQTFKSSYLRD